MKKEIIHMGNNDRCDTCFEQGKVEERKRILKIINEKQWLQYSCGRSTDYVTEIVFEDSINKLKQKIEEK